MIIRIPSETQLVLWLFIGGISAWGGLVRYILDMQMEGGRWSWASVLCQLIVSCFNGLLGGLLSFEQGSSPYMTFLIAGVFGSLGNTALAFLWKRIFGKSGYK